MDPAARSQYDRRTFSRVFGVVLRLGDRHRRDSKWYSTTAFAEQSAGTKSVVAKDDADDLRPDSTAAKVIQQPFFWPAKT